MEIDKDRPLHKAIPQAYAKGFPFDDIGIPFNGSGWESDEGNTGACVSLFVENPNCVAVEVEPADASVTNSSNFYDCIQAKIGSEYLKRANVNLTPKGASIWFQDQTKRQYQTGIQLASLAMMGPQELSAGNSRFRLLKVSWHRDEQERGEK